MKYLLLLLSFQANAVTCILLESEGATATASTKLEAEKKAWKSCIDRKLLIRSHYRKDINEDEVLGDAEACLNARMECK